VRQQVVRMREGKEEKERKKSQTYHRLVLNEHLIVGTDGHEENNSGDAVKAVNPLLPLGALATHVEHPVDKVTNLELGLGDTRRLNTGAEDVLVVGEVAWCRNTVDAVKVVFCGVVQLVLAGAVEAGQNSSISPESLNGLSHLGRENLGLDLAGHIQNPLSVRLLN